MGAASDPFQALGPLHSPGTFTNSLAVMKPHDRLCRHYESSCRDPSIGDLQGETLRVPSCDIRTCGSWLILVSL